MEKYNDLDVQIILKMKDNFENISIINIEITTIFKIIDLKISKLKEIYKNFIDVNNNNDFIFELDSLYFQSKIIELENSQKRIMHTYINNRIYAAYYKLFKIISQYVKKNFVEKEILDIINVIFIVYKDIEPLKNYDFESIKEIYNTIIQILITLNKFLANNMKEIKYYEESQTMGLDITNFLNKYIHINILIKDEVQLYIKYIEYLYDLYIKYYNKFINNVKTFQHDIETNIILDKIELKNIIKVKPNIKDNISNVESKENNELKTDDKIENNKNINVDNTNNINNMDNKYNSLWTNTIVDGVNMTDIENIKYNCSWDDIINNNKHEINPNKYNIPLRTSLNYAYADNYGRRRNSKDKRKSNASDTSISDKSSFNGSIIALPTNNNKIDKK
jgi:hypothetical protein